MGLSDLDEIAGFDGFGNALAVVDWVARDEDVDSLIFMNFLDHNEPACLRKPAKSNAERQAKWRAENPPKKKAVTESNESNAREEKRRSKPIAKKTAIPENWLPKPETLDSLTAEFKHDAGDYIAPFIDACKAKNYLYADFEAAFRNCVRKDWPQLRVAPAKQGASW